MYDESNAELVHEARDELVKRFEHSKGMDIKDTINATKGSEEELEARTVLLVQKNPHDMLNAGVKDWEVRNFPPPNYAKKGNNYAKKGCTFYVGQSGAGAYHEGNAVIPISMKCSVKQVHKVSLEEFDNHYDRHRVTRQQLTGMMSGWKKKQIYGWELDIVQLSLIHI